jgi:hypothetical protein
MAFCNIASNPARFLIAAFSMEYEGVAENKGWKKVGP